DVVTWKRFLHDRFVVDRPWPVFPPLGFERFADAHHLVDHFRTILSSRRLRSTRPGMQRGSGFTCRAVTDFIEHAARDFQRPTKLRDRQSIGLGGIVVDNGSPKTG